MDTMQTGLSVLMLPWLAHGHISPFLELAKKLIKRNFFIYLCSTPINLLSIKKKINHSLSNSIELVEIHLRNLPNLPAHYHTANGLPRHLMSTLFQAFEMAKPNLSEILNKLNPDIFIHDMIVLWAGEVASSHNIPAIVFITAGAASNSFYFHTMIHPGVEYPFPAIYLLEFEKNKVFPDIESAGKDHDFGGKKSAAKGNHASERPKTSRNISLIKSFRELEGKYIDHLTTLDEETIIPVGPLIEDPVDGLGEDMEVMEWLSKKDKSSSIFVSFGSEYFLSKEEMEEIAHGLELSNVNFIWVVRFAKGGERSRVEEVLPEGFFDRVRERGMVVVGWAPQTKILRHESIGGFLSHCGWGSVLESMKYGVPIIALPMQLDQPLNARLAVEVSVGVEVVRDKSGRIKREEVAKVIREVVVEKAGEDVRRKASEFSEKLRIKGEEEIDGLVKNLVQICEQSKEQSRG